MGILDDVMKTLDRIPIWKRLNEVPEEVDSLKARVNELEAKLGGKWPADVCRMCGARAARLGHTILQDKVSVERWDCSDCNQSDFRHVKFK